MSWPWPEEPEGGFREETHYDGRRMLCYARRPDHVDAMFRATVDRAPDAEALVDGETRLGYAELHARVARVAGGLRALGLEAGDRVAVALGNRVEFVLAALACYRLGLIAVPLNIRMRAPEYAFVLQQCGARALIHEAAVAPYIPADAPALRFVCGGSADGARDFAELEEGEPVWDSASGIAEEDVATLLYTSGTTGRPKGAMLTHLGLIHSCLHFRTGLGLGQGEDERERCILAVPASHVTGLVAIVLAMVATGGCTILMREFKARAYLELAERERVTYTVMVPAMYNLCLREPDFAEFDLSSWRLGGYGGAPMPEATIGALAERLPNLALCNAYGATETTSPTTIMPPGHTGGHEDSVGLVVPCGQVRVVDDDGRDVAPGEGGELWIAGPMVVPGYWDNEAANRENFEGGYWKSGDIGSIDAEGYVRVFDRKKDMINRAGFKIYSVEVENVLSHHPDVLEVAIIGQPDEVLGERVHAVVVPSREGVDPEALKGFCAERLSDYKVPDRITLLEEPLPRNPNGKVVKPTLRERLGA